MVTAADVKKLREQTGAGMLDAKKALDEAQGDFEQATELLRKRGQKIAAKKADRDATEGIIDCYIHANGKIGVLLELNCETDFVARNDAFKDLAHSIALVVAASNPVATNPEDVSQDLVDKELAAAREQAEKEGKPADIIEKVLEGKEKKVRQELSLMGQSLVTDPDKTVAEAVVEGTAALGEKITVGRFARLDK
ncbi:MAG: translation elongation factor Ts [Candidatus Doudnabacteria bacterium]|nr:translation elongation factor Ts [Candidatus Doudnabacteria bacterium]MCA9387489.1 translation elongation factor Ts [Candidatus Andersenbacteria bacterium]